LSQLKGIVGKIFVLSSQSTLLESGDTTGEWRYCKLSYLLFLTKSKAESKDYAISHFDSSEMFLEMFNFNRAFSFKYLKPFHIIDTSLHSRRGGGIKLSADGSWREACWV
jgi:hypothetical protein